MSREVPIGGTRWSMWCNACDFKDARQYRDQPALHIFADEGWYIGLSLDACPSCALAAAHGFRPHPHFPYISTSAPDLTSVERTPTEENR